MSGELKTIKLSFVVLLAIVITMAMWSPHAFATCSTYAPMVETGGAGYTRLSGYIFVPNVYQPSALRSLLSDSLMYKYTYVGTGSMPGSAGCSPGCGDYAPCVGGSNFVLQGDTLYFTMPICVTGCACGAYVVTLSSVSYNPATYDFDCDNIPDVNDEDPDSVDSDNDGFFDDNDPWPADASCPSLGSFRESMTYTHSTGCTIHIYEDVNGHCSDFRTTNCGFGVVDLVNPCPDFKDYWNECLTGEDWSHVSWGYIGNQAGKDYSSIVSPAVVPGASGSPGGSGVPSGGGATGTVDPNSLASSDLKKLADLINGVQGQDAVTNKLLDDIRRILGDSMGFPAGLAGGTGQGEGNTLTDQVSAGVEEAIEETTDDPGDSGIPGDPNFETLESQTAEGDPTQGDADGLLDTEQANLTAYINDWLEETPIYQLLTGTTIEAEGSQCYVSCEVFGQEVQFSMCDESMVDFLDLLGYFVLGLASIYAIVIVFGRG